MKEAQLEGRIRLHLSRIGKAVSSPVRLAILEVLGQGERPVEAIAREVRHSVANTSHHLQVLREARLVEGRKSGLHVYYRLAHPKVIGLQRAMRLLAEEQYEEVQRLLDVYVHRRDRLEAVSREELVARARAGTVVVLDVRPASEYRAGHIPGALSVPLAQLASRLGELPGGAEIVAYCRGPYCLLAFDAVERLRAEGRSARRLVEGFPEWQADGLPVDVSAEEGSA
jgi:rhodanese-related sulfurtransferase